MIVAIIILGVCGMITVCTVASLVFVYKVRRLPAQEVLALPEPKREDISVTVAQTVKDVLPILKQPEIAMISPPKLQYRTKCTHCSCVYGYMLSVVAESWTTCPNCKYRNIHVSSNAVNS